MNDIFVKAKKFSKAQRRAEKKGQDEFVCPLCGGSAWWARMLLDNRLNCGCKNCNFLVIGGNIYG